MKNFINLNSFVSYWRKYSEFREMTNGDRFFNAEILYEFDGKTINGETMVSIEINGYNNGNVHLYERMFLMPTFFIWISPRTIRNIDLMEKIKPSK